jgi:hypothetical protein
MEILSYIGVLIFILGCLGFLVAAFQESIIWGLGCLIVSPVSLVFLVMHWQQAKNPFFLQIIGLVIIMAADYMGSEAGF